jgi:hypothetical protein
MLFICLMVGNVDRRRPRSVHAGDPGTVRAQDGMGEIVHVCALEGHPTASQAYAWSSTFDSHALMAKRLRHLQ